MGKVIRPRPSDHGLPRPRSLGRVWGGVPGGRGRGRGLWAQLREKVAERWQHQPGLPSRNLQARAGVAETQAARRCSWLGTGAPRLAWLDPGAGRGRNHGSSHEVHPQGRPDVPFGVWELWGFDQSATPWLSLSPRDFRRQNIEFRGNGDEPSGPGCPGEEPLPQYTLM